LKAVQALDNETLFRKVLIPRTLGLEDSSRYYLPAMVLWHLIYIGQTIQEGIISLSKNEALDFIVKIENFKPFIEIDPNIVSEFELFLTGYRSSIESSVKNRYIRNFHAHPWFGPLNPHQWLIMSAVHQVVHGRQLHRILNSKGQICATYQISIVWQ
jgi:hypothetical protein